MKKSKILIVLATAAMCVTLSVTASAATTSDVISKLQANGATATQVAQAQDFFKSNSFTSAQLSDINASVDKAEAIMKENNVTDPTQLPESALSELKDIVTSTASEVGVTVSFSKNSAGVSAFTVSKGGSTYTFNGNDSTTKTTGSDSTIPVALLAAGLLLSAGSAAYVVSSRRKAAIN